MFPPYQEPLVLKGLQRLSALCFCHCHQSVHHSTSHYWIRFKKKDHMCVNHQSLLKSQLNRKTKPCR